MSQYLADHGWLGWILIGLIAGAIAKALMPGRDPGGFIVTALIGIVGAVIGGFLGNMIFGIGGVGEGGRHGGVMGEMCESSCGQS